MGSICSHVCELPVLSIDAVADESCIGSVGSESYRNYFTCEAEFETRSSGND
jgi:hypothetical protein